MNGWCGLSFSMQEGKNERERERKKEMSFVFIGEAM